MAGYRFRAFDQAGKLRRGVLEVDSPRQARAQLRSHNLWPLELQPITQTPAGRRRPLPRLGAPRLGAVQLALLMRQFATLLSAKLSLEQTLNALIDQADSQNLRELLAGLRGEVLAGHSLSGAMKKFPRAFSDMVRTLVAAGERSGRLDEVLGRLADYAEQRQALRSKVGLALLYPLIVTAAAAGVIGVLMTYVVPQVVGVFQNGQQTLPWLTRALIAGSDFLRASGLYCAAAVLAVGVAGWRALREPRLRFRFDTALLALPLVGSLIRSANAARFAATMAILVQSGVPVLPALQAAAGVVSNRPMRRAVEETERLVREGGSLSRGLARTRMFPPLLAHLVANGEASGELGALLGRAAATQARELEHRVALLTGLLEPLLILFMGIVVLLIVLATLMPIIELNNLIR